MVDPAGIPSIVVVGTDGSSTAQRAVARAAALCAALNARLVVVSAYNNRAPGGAAATGIATDASFVMAQLTTAETVAEAAVEAARVAGVTDIVARAEAGEPAESLLRVVNELGADLLVVGSKGMQSTARFLSGPIANKVSKKVSCDLLIVETSD